MSSKIRCPWCESTSVMQKYHDTEWGVPLKDDRKLFEFIVLDAAQAGLSWSIVLNKRENYRQVLFDYDVEKIAKITPAYEQKMLQNPGIVRNRLKVASCRKNAAAFLAVQEEKGSFARYLWDFVDGSPVQNAWKTQKQFPASTPLSDTISKNLKKRGFTFVGTTITYAFLQAAGVVNDHLVDCHRHSVCANLGKEFKV